MILDQTSTSFTSPSNHHQIRSPKDKKTPLKSLPIDHNSYFLISIKFISSLHFWTWLLNHWTFFHPSNSNRSTSAEGGGGGPWWDSKVGELGPRRTQSSISLNILKQPTGQKNPNPYLVPSTFLMLITRLKANPLTSSNLFKIPITTWPTNKELQAQLLSLGQLLSSNLTWIATGPHKIQNEIILFLTTFSHPATSLSPEVRPLELSSKKIT